MYSTVVFFCKVSDARLALKIYAAKQSLKKPGMYPKSIKIVQLNY